MPLADTQAELRHAIGRGDAAQPPDMLQAPRGVEPRLAIYRRHFRESLTRHLRGRFPTVEWLLGWPQLAPVIDAFIRAHPPKSPCMAEYGEDFIAALGRAPIGRKFPYLADLARLDWQLGTAAVALELPALPVSALAAVPAGTLPDLCLALQPGLFFMSSAWPVDVLVQTRLSKDIPDRLAFTADAVHLQIRGARGHYAISRVAATAGQFRVAVAAGRPLGAAAEQALATDTGFDVGGALAALFAEGLVVAAGS